MDKMLKKGLNRKRKLKIGYFVACLFGAKYKWNFLRKNKVFAYLGDNVLFQPNMLPNDSQYIKLHENVQVATGVTFFNHDVINTVFSKMHTSEKDVLQLLFRLGTFQLSDIFYNTVGGMIGGLMYCAVMKAKKRL